MAGRSGFVRRAAAAAIVAAVACACATPPPPLPSRRTQFAPAAAPVPRAADLPTPTVAPIRHQHYGWMLLVADLAGTVFLASWMGRREDVYLVAPSLAAGPLLHAAHGEYQTAGISLLMRTAMIGGVYLASRSLEDEASGCDEFVCVPLRSVLLAELAIIPVVVIDAAWLARRTIDVDGWHRLPVISAGIDRTGGRYLTLTTPF